ncbi:hypothetical protein MP638_006665 [Amoeboaphelidium occidentale]|nr:hypothetical protein MP638_006665 [Amoeboaphelidium occidentale]
MFTFLLLKICEHHYLVLTQRVLFIMFYRYEFYIGTRYFRDLNRLSDWFAVDCEKPQGSSRDRAEHTLSEILIAGSRRLLVRADCFEGKSRRTIHAAEVATWFITEFLLQGNGCLYYIELDEKYHGSSRYNDDIVRSMVILRELERKFQCPIIFVRIGIQGNKLAPNCQELDSIYKQLPIILNHDEYHPFSLYLVYFNYDFHLKKYDRQTRFQEITNFVGDHSAHITSYEPSEFREQRITGARITRRSEESNIRAFCIDRKFPALFCSKLKGTGHKGLRQKWVCSCGKSYQLDKNGSLTKTIKNHIMRCKQCENDPTPDKEQEFSSKMPEKRWTCCCGKSYMLKLNGEFTSWIAKHKTKCCQRSC